MWRIVSKMMKQCKVLTPGSYDRHNHHGGVMPGWPKESTMTNLRASKILRACIQSGKLTFSQLETVRKTMSFLWELEGTKTKRDSNWPCVGSLFESTVRKDKLAPKKREGRPTRIARPQDLKHAINKGWSNANRYPFLQWLSMYICFWDSQICGGRAFVDMEKIKKSRTHDYNFKAGWQCTQFVDGRAKLTGPKKGTREWWTWRVCMCRTKRHRRPGKNAWSAIDDDGNPTRPLDFDERCPLAALEMVWQCQLEEDQPKRDYPNWVLRSTKSPAWFGARNIGDPTQAALDWMEAQGLETFDHNSGRKALAGYCNLLSIPYGLSVHIHGDLHDVWNKHYQSDVPETLLKIREQSRDPQMATAALRIFASYCGRGIDPYKPPMKLAERQQHELLKCLKGARFADNILMGIPGALDGDGDQKPSVVKPEPSSDEDDRPYVPFRPKPAPKKRKRKRKPARQSRACRKRAPPLVPPSSDDDDLPLLPPRPRKRRRRTLMVPPKAARSLLKQKKKRKKSKPSPPPALTSRAVFKKRRPSLRIRLRPLWGGRFRLVPRLRL